MLRTLKHLRKSMIQTIDEENIGEIKDFYFDDQEWAIRYLVVDIGTWINEKLVFISPVEIDEFSLGGFTIKTNLTKVQIEQGPLEENHKPLERPFVKGHLRSFNDVIGYSIHAADKQFGHIEDMVMNDENYKVSYLIVDTINFWPSKSVLIIPALLADINWAQREVRTELSHEEVECSPRYDPFDFIDRPETRI